MIEGGTSYPHYIQIRDGYLVIRGEKQFEHESTEGQYHVTECAYGHFERAIPLPEEVEPVRPRPLIKKCIACGAAQVCPRPAQESDRGD
ncbi:Hsp20/alpha crystallin family protein [Allochromatium tepidum]|uniref:Hsp20/alpha crystallin family protein n=1 Tax=Allochromatium tepidum TaxID=553982 RepID=UPI001BCFADF8